jgi:hypothetical protein
MPISNNVYAVLGRLLIDPGWSSGFYDQPIPTARGLVGSTTPEDDAQLTELANLSRDPVFSNGDLTGTLNALRAAVCPHFPCPASGAAAAASSQSV